MCNTFHKVVDEVVPSVTETVENITELSPLFQGFVEAQKSIATEPTLEQVLAKGE